MLDIQKKIRSENDSAPDAVELNVLAREQHAHTIFDINSVAMFRRLPLESQAGRSIAQQLRTANHSIFATAGDDGCIKVWRYNESQC
jgi:hypothetical protein